ncbi:MAG: BspA family leucine-rich repeat surface protein, partial [Hyphomicrobiales bacterium]
YVLLFLINFIPIQLFADEDELDGTSLITVWKTDNLRTGSSNATSIEISVQSSSKYYDIDFNNDGHFEVKNVRGDYTHDFGEAGTYTIRIRGDFSGFDFSYSGDCLKLLEIKQWGNIQFEALYRAFENCENLKITAKDSPDLSRVSSIAYAFYNATNFTGDLSSWDVSNVTDMSGVFCGATNFTGDLSSWDVSNVTNMSNIFHSATNFTGDLSSWDVSNVTNMNNIFHGATNFTGDLSSWDVSNVTYMSGMFYGARNFTGDLSSWDVSNVTYMNGMFYGARNFTGDLSSWDVSNVTNMSGMFHDARAFTGDLNSWDVSNVTNMSNMFYGARNFTGDLSSWDVSNVTDMNYMFKGASNFNGNISSWDVSNVIHMNYMFSGASSFNGDISSWNISKVIDFQSFIDLTSFSVENYSKLLASWGQKNILERYVYLDVKSVNYKGAAAKAGRQRLIDDYGWFISDGGDFNYKPVITSGQTFEIAENTRNNAVMGTVKATDKNLNTTLFAYKILSGNEAGIFDIKDNGELFVSNNSKLDYDDSNLYTLNITVSDGEKTSEEGTVIVNVTDFNYAPVIEASQTFTVEEEVSNNLIIGTIKASDKDDNDQLQNWTIVSGNESGIFEINRDGALCIKDKSGIGSRRGFAYTLTITVSDGQATSEAVELVVNINKITGLSETNEVISYKLVPNPAKDHFSIVSETYPIRAEIVNMSGHVVVSAIQYGQNDQIPVQLKSGVYLVKIMEEGKMPQVKRLVVR